MTDPGQRNELDPTIGGDVEGVYDAPTVVPDNRAPEFDATLGLDDDDATVFPDESPETDAATVVTDDDDDDAAVFPDDDQTVSPDMEPAATVVSDSVPATVVEPPIEDDLTVVPDESEDDDLTVYGDDDEPPRGNDDPTMVREEVPTQMIDGAPAATVLESQALDSVSETSTGESQSGSKSRLSFVKGKGSKSKRGKAAEPKKSESEGPRYELVDNFAHGGMGNIWKANDQRIHRDVAYKELLPRALKRPRVVERFVQEAQITGQLEHPCIVPIYDLGNKESGEPFYAMKLIHGTEMKDVIEEMHKLSKESVEYKRMFIQLLRGLIDTCNAMAFAHERGVLHRDLKPQNVMLGGFGETLVLDWGLAKILDSHEAGGEGGVKVSGNYDDKFDADEEPSAESLGDLSEATNVTKIMDESRGLSLSPAHITATVKTDSRSEGTETKYGSVMGTPAYMPPEQAEGKLNLMDARTDIYSLGAILYEILTNDAPIPRGKMTQMLDHVKNKPIRPPIEIVPTTPRQLDAIALKALSKRREDRYTTALELARDIEDYLADEPVSAYPEPWYERTRRWVKRHRTLVTTSSAVVLVVILGSLAWSSWESARLNELQTTVESKMDEAKKLSGTGDFDEAKVLLNEADSLVEGEESLAAVDGLIEAAERDRLNAQTLDVEQELILIRDMIEARNELNDALAALTAIVTNLADEPDLTELHGRAEAKLNAVTQQIESQERRALAQQQYQKFLDLADRARFYATVTTGDDLLQNAGTAQNAADSAFQLYGGLSEDYLTSAPPLLSESQVEKVRSGSYELLLIYAETELTLVQNDDEESRKAAAAKALKALQQAEALGIQSRALFLRRARYYDAAGDINQRDLTLSDAEGHNPTTALDLFLVGEEQRRSGKFEDALQSYRLALQAEPDHFWSLHQMALTHLLSGQADAAVAGYTACIARRPDERICYLSRGIAYASLKQFGAAEADLDRAGELDPNLYAVYLNRGAVYVAQEKLHDAIADFERAAELRAGYAGPFVNLGEVYRIQKKYSDSEAALTRAVELDENNVKAYRIRALTRLQLMKADDARADFERVVELDDDPLSQADAHYQIGNIRNRGDEPEMALEAYDKSIVANSKNSNTYRLKAEVLLALNRDEEAVAAFTKCLEFGPPVGDVYRARSLAYSKLGRFREAMNDYTRALELEPSANMLVRRGWAYLLEANQLALADFDAAVSKNPDNADAWNGRGYSRVMLGDYARAIADADEAVKRAAKQVEVEGPSAWPHIYNAATIYAQAVGKVLQDGRRKPEDREKLASQLTVKAIQIIAQAINAAGPGQRAAVAQTLQADTALNPIRNRPEFRQAFAPKPPQNNN